MGWGGGAGGLWQPDSGARAAPAILGLMVPASLRKITHTCAHTRTLRHCWGVGGGQGGGGTMGARVHRTGMG